MKRLILFSLIGAVIAAGQNRRAGTRRGATGTPGAATELLRILQEEVDPDQISADVRTLWETDRWLTFPKFVETARNVTVIMRRAGLEDVEIGNPPADGVTQAGFWTMPLAWDVKVGTLEIVEPEVPAEMQVVADYQKVPTSVCMWSGPAPPGGVTTEVVAFDRDLENHDLKGKLVLARRATKTSLAKAGACGLISESTENPDLADDRRWVNSFGDNGWSFTKDSTPLVCISITPRGSRLLRGLLQKGPVKVRVNVDACYYEGVYPFVTRVIRGTDGDGAEEGLSLEHLYEQGAHDNSTGVASIIHAAGTIHRLIEQGKLPRPKRAIRVLGMGECYGTNYYLAHNADRGKRTVAAMCIDSPAGLYRLAGTEHTWIVNPHSAASYVDALILRLAAECYPMVGRPWHWVEYRSSTDNYLGDPSIGIPTVMPRGGYGVMAHHNSADTPATIDPRSLRDLTVMNAAYTYFIASAGPGEKRWMAELALTRGYDALAAAAGEIIDQIAVAENADQLGRLLHQSREMMDYRLDRESAAVHSAWDLKEELADLATFAEIQKTRLKRSIRARAKTLGTGEIREAIPARNQEAEKIVVRRTRLGTLPLEDLPQEEREGYPAAGFWAVPTSALYWCNGRRNLAEVIRLTELEMGSQSFDFLGYFKFLERHGYVEFVSQAN